MIAVNNGNYVGLFSNIGEIGVSGFMKQNYIYVKNNFKFYLKQNYPNPFNPTTIIKYQLPEDAHVKLIIYDVLGRELTTLVNGFEEAGYKSVGFDANNFPSRVYFCKLTAGSHTSLKKMLLLR